MQTKFHSNHSDIHVQFKERNTIRNEQLMDCWMAYTNEEKENSRIRVVDFVNVFIV